MAQPLSRQQRRVGRGEVVHLGPPVLPPDESGLLPEERLVPLTDTDLAPDYSPTVFQRAVARRHPEIGWLACLSPEDRAWYRDHVWVTFLRDRYPGIADEVWRKLFRGGPQ